VSKRKIRSAAPGPPPSSHVLKVGRDGDWLGPDEFRKACAEAVDTHLDVYIDLEGVDHLDASALQILLALRVEQQQNGHRLSLGNPSPALVRWFEFAGATQMFSLAPAS